MLPPARGRDKRGGRIPPEPPKVLRKGNCEMGDLFEAATKPRPNLAARARPVRLEDVVGQDAAIGPRTPIGLRLRSERIGSVILYGPSGTGKTTIARAVGARTNKTFRTLHPAESGVAEIRALAAEARKTEVLAFLDEAQRYNVTSLEMLLGYVEEGLFDLILATTGNPYHVLPYSLVSRSVVAQLEAIVPADMEAIVVKALALLAREGLNLDLTRGQVEVVAARAGGDARRALIAIEDMSRVCPADGTPTRVDDAYIAMCFSGSPVASDRKGDSHYDVASAFIKSMRAGDRDATIYWLSRMIHTGEDPRFIARRIMIQASEDVGLADNSALSTATAALTAVTNVGYPEARIILAHAALHVAMAPKSNSAYRAINAGMAYVETQALVRVPDHLRDAHYKSAAKLGHEGYRTPHDYADAVVPDQDHLPGVAPGTFYRSDEREPTTFEARANAHRERSTGEAVPRRAMEG